jgi:regulator of protease activity HflC (stomatin/prohibitin superfamily)
MPGLDRMVRVELRTITLTIPPQEVITRDNVPARVAAVCYFRVVDPVAAVTEIEAFAPATSQIAQTTLRSVLGGADLDQLLAERERLNEDLQKIIDEQTEPWGIKVSTVEIKDVEIPEAMQRAMARQAEAERERRAKIIMSEGELQAAQRLAEAARLMAGDPAALQLRLYQTMVEVASQPNMTIVLPVPIELLAGGPNAQATQAAQATAQNVINAAAALAGNANAKQLAAATPASDTIESLKAALAEARAEAKPEAKIEAKNEARPEAKKDKVPR